MPPAAATPPTADHPPLTPISLDAAPAEVLARWTQVSAVACLMSPQQPASTPVNPHGRWSLLAPVDRVTTSLDALAAAQPAQSRGLAVLGPDAPPFGPGWIGLLGYDLGRDLEPRAAFLRPFSEPSHPNPPSIWLARCDRALIFDHHLRQWWSMDATPERNPNWYRDFLPSPSSAAVTPPPPAFRRGPLRPDVPRVTFEGMVQRVLDYIRAGDCYQVNLAHRLRATFEGDARALTAALLAAARPWYGCHLDIQHEGHRWTLAGASPERFLEIAPPHADGTRTITTRPMKGTRRASAEGSHEDLRQSTKDRAELAMIVDLMRNDLGRVAMLGSVRVAQARTIEQHGTGEGALLQSTATISATLAPGTTIIDVLRATFPPGSITGAPKIRAMQIIDELEHARRGPYCGSVGYFGDDGSAQLNVAIRTALISPPKGEAAAEGEAAASTNRPSHYNAGSTLSYWVGAGIVADSTPASEWDETLAKASAIEGAGTGEEAQAFGIRG